MCKVSNDSILKNEWISIDEIVYQTKNHGYSSRYVTFVLKIVQVNI